MLKILENHPFKPAILLYILKCVIGLSICYILYKSFPEHQFFWSMITVLIVIAPDAKDAVKLATDRMIANILGSAIGILLFIMHHPNLFIMCMGVLITISIGTLLKLTNALRPALAAMLIVMIHEKEGSTWEIALERVICVITGCVVALGVTLLVSGLYNYFTKARQK